MKNKILKILAKMVFILALLVVGFGAGLCVNVFLVRGVPILSGGGEVVVFIAIPTAWVLGYNKGVKVTEKRWRRRYDRNQYQVR